LEIVGFEFPLGTTEILLCSMSAPHVKFVPLLDVHQLLMLFARTLKYLEPKTSSLIIFDNGSCIILKHYFFIILSGVRLSPLGTAGTTGLLHQPQMIDDNDCGAIGGL
jgi:hypothetical protein